MLGFVKQRILPLTNKPLPGAFAQVVVDRGAGEVQKSTPIMMPQCLSREAIRSPLSTRLLPVLAAPCLSSASPRARASRLALCTFRRVVPDHSRGRPPRRLPWTRPPRPRGLSPSPRVPSFLSPAICQRWHGRRRRGPRRPPLRPSPPPALDRTPPPSPPPRTETSLPGRARDRRRPCAQRLAVLRRRLHPHDQGGATAEAPEER